MRPTRDVRVAPQRATPQRAVFGLAAATAVLALTSAALAWDAGAQAPRPAGAAATSPPRAPASTAAAQAPAKKPKARRSAVRPHAAKSGVSSAVETLSNANAAARQRPLTSGFQQARQVYTYAVGAIFELYANPSYISTILLEPGETLNEIAAGDTSRWMVQQTSTETETDGRTVVLVKPQSTGLRTNIVLVTDRRTYTIEAIAQSGPVYSAQIAWRYPDAFGAGAEGQFGGEMFTGYKIRTVRGQRPRWMPSRVADDGRRTWIEFPAAISATDMPPLFVITGEGAELVNYRVQGVRFIVDRTFDIAELRLGTRAPVIVRIERVRSGPRGAQPWEGGQ